MTPFNLPRLDVVWQPTTVTPARHPLSRTHQRDKLAASTRYRAQNLNPYRATAGDARFIDPERQPLGISEGRCQRDALVSHDDIALTEPSTFDPTRHAATGRKVKVHP